MRHALFSRFQAPWSEGAGAPAEAHHPAHTGRGEFWAAQFRPAAKFKRCDEPCLSLEGLMNISGGARVWATPAFA